MSEEHLNQLIGPGIEITPLGGGYRNSVYLTSKDPPTVVKFHRLPNAQNGDQHLIETKGYRLCISANVRVPKLLTSNTQSRFIEIEYVEGALAKDADYGQCIELLVDTESKISGHTIDWGIERSANYFSDVPDLIEGEYGRSVLGAISSVWNETLTQIQDSNSFPSIGSFIPNNVIISKEGPKHIDLEMMCMAPPGSDLSYFSIMSGDPALFVTYLRLGGKFSEKQYRSMAIAQGILMLGVYARSVRNKPHVNREIIAERTASICGVIAELVPKIRHPINDMGEKIWS